MSLGGYVVKSIKTHTHTVKESSHETSSDEALATEMEEEIGFFFSFFLVLFLV